MQKGKKCLRVILKSGILTLIFLLTRHNFVMVTVANSTFNKTIFISKTIIRLKFTCFFFSRFQILQYLTKKCFAIKNCPVCYTITIINSAKHKQKTLTLNNDCRSNGSVFSNAVHGGTSIFSTVWCSCIGYGQLLAVRRHSNPEISTYERSIFGPRYCWVWISSSVTIYGEATSFFCSDILRMNCDLGYIWSQCHKMLIFTVWIFKRVATRWFTKR